MLSAVDVVLRDGSTVRVRDTGPADAAPLADFLRALSPQSRYFRFFSASADFDQTATRMMDRGTGLLAFGPAGQIVAHGVYLPRDGSHAEVAFAVSDGFQGHGLGTLLLGQLAETASAAGIETFEAVVLFGNKRMIGVFRESGFPLTIRWEAGELAVAFPTRLTTEALEKFEGREQSAAAAAIGHILAPTTVAVFGATERPGAIGGQVFRNLIANGYTGRLIPVNGRGGQVEGIDALRSAAELPDAVDLAVIVVPGAAVNEVARACAARRVRSLLVIAAGFSESGAEGRERQAELVDICRRSGMRLVGPNCLGVQNTSPAVRLNATFAPGFPHPGGVGFLSQSGGLGLAVIERSRRTGLGLSSFVSIGNKADLSGNDFLNYWEGDPETSVILMYLESFGNPRKFARIARRVSRTKPILVVKAGRSAAGTRATSSHTGALLAASDIAVDALFRQAGVIRMDTLSEAFETASLLAAQPLPAGPRTAIVTNAGGPGILCADACEAYGLELPTTPGPVVSVLRTFLAAEASLDNPVDMIASALPEQFRRTIEEVGRSGAYDAVIAIFTPPAQILAADVCAAIREAAHSIRPIPVLAVVMAEKDSYEALAKDGFSVPSYAFPEDAARSLAHAARLAAWRAEPLGSAEPPADVDKVGAREIIAGALAGGPAWMQVEESRRLLGSYGITTVESQVAASAAAAGRIAASFGGPVAVKGIAEGLLHKSDVGAVRLGLGSATAVREESRRMAGRLRRAGLVPSGFAVQRMAPAGVEILVGVVHDRIFGPLVACGAGGTLTEVMGDVAVRITPLTDRDATAMVASLRVATLLHGHRGSPPVDVAALEDLLLRVGALVDANPEIAEMDLNPVVVHASGAIVADWRIRLEPAPPSRPLGAR